MKKFFVISIVLLFLLTSCNLLSPATPTVDPVVKAMQQTLDVQNAVATLQAQTQAAAPVVPPTSAVPTLAPVVPTVAAPPTEVPVVKVTANVNANCRSGPGGNFDYMGVLNQGQSADVIGKFTGNGTWWKVKLGDKECWVTGDAVAVTGDANSVAMLVSPPTPTPVPPPNWTGSWTILFSDNPTSPEINASVIYITMTQTGQTVTANFVSGGSPHFNISIVGTVSADGKTVNGTLTYSTTPYVLLLVRTAENIKQFRGKFYAASNPGFDGAMCGGTGGASYPSPCRP
jgi:uncharacterized protein YraI